MGLLYNRVRETSTTTGTGNLTLAGAVTGFHAFNDKVPTGTTVRYVIAHQSANEHEYGIGTFTATSTLARTTVLGGSNGTSAVNLSAGTKDVFVDALAEDFGLSNFPRISGLRYPGGYVQYSGNGTITLDQLVAVPYWVGRATAFDGIAIAALGTASAYCRLGLYRDDGTKPGALIVDAGQVDCSSGGEKVASITQTLYGLIWVAAVGQGVAPSVTRADDVLHPMLGTSGVYSTPGGIAYSQTGVSGALPDPWGSTYTPLAASTVVPLLALRVA